MRNAVLIFILLLPVLLCACALPNVTYEGEWVVNHPEGGRSVLHFESDGVTLFRYDSFGLVVSGYAGAVTVNDDETLTVQLTEVWNGSSWGLIGGNDWLVDVTYDSATLSWDDEGTVTVFSRS